METDISKLKIMAEDTVTHKKLVLDACHLMFEYFIEHGDVQMGIDILKRGATHDNSKLDNAEFKRMAAIFKGRGKFSKDLTPDDRISIEAHWKKNRHHPEYFESYNEMSELDIVEMVCDWFARSIQFGNDLNTYIIEVQQPRFGFDEAIMEKLLSYSNILNDLYKRGDMYDN